MLCLNGKIVLLKKIVPFFVDCVRVYRKVLCHLLNRDCLLVILAHGSGWVRQGWEARDRRPFCTHGLHSAVQTEPGSHWVTTGKLLWPLWLYSSLLVLHPRPGSELDLIPCQDSGSWPECEANINVQGAERESGALTHHFSSVCVWFSEMLLIGSQAHCNLPLCLACLFVARLKFWESQQACVGLGNSQECFFMPE